MQRQIIVGPLGHPEPRIAHACLPKSDCQTPTDIRRPFKMRDNVTRDVLSRLTALASVNLKAVSRSLDCCTEEHDKARTFEVEFRHVGRNHD